MYHDIERDPVSFFLREVNLKKLSGHLFVNAKDFQITLNFMDGKLANGMSTRFDEKLSVILHLMGRINEEQYNFLSGLHQFSDDQVAGILLDHNFAKKKDIYYARIYQLRRIAISIFALQRGVWIFTAGEPDPPLRETFEIPLEGILVEGARAVDHVSTYANKWQFAVPVLFSEIPMAVEIYFTDGERDFFAALQRQGGLSCREHIARLNLVPLDFWRSMLAFHLMGIIELEKGEEGPDISVEIAALLEFEKKLRAAPASDPGLLGLLASAPAAAVAAARDKLLERFAPERFGSAAAPEIKKLAREVCRRLRAFGVAPEVQAKPPAGRELPGELEWNLGPEAVETPAAGEESEEEFELSAEFAIDDEPAAMPEIAFATEEPAGDATPVPGLGPLAAMREIVFASEEPAGDATPVPGMGPPAAMPEVIFDAEEQADEAPPAPVMEPPAEEPARKFAAETPPASLRMVDADHEKAWDLLLQSKELYEKHEYARAMPLLKKAIKLLPGQGDFHYLLGLCQSESEMSRNEAEINLKKAIELKSWSADPVYALGVLYRSQGKAKLAERCFQRVKEIAYEHTGASRALVDIRRQKAGGGPHGLKKKKF
jgi:tetratricopeptide (TPR) repeat protein